MSIRDFLKSIISVVLIASGIFCFILMFIITKVRTGSVGNSYGLMITADVMIAIFSLINLICGFAALIRRKPRMVLHVRPFVQVGVIIAFIQTIVSASNGILMNHLVMLVIAGIIIPELFFLLIGMIMKRG